MPIGAARAGILGSGIAIPDSVTNRFKLDEGSGTTVADSIGSLSATLTAGNWVSASKYTGGAAFDFAGTDHLKTDSAFDVNGSQASVGIWLTDMTGGDSFPRVVATHPSGSTAISDGFLIQMWETNTNSVAVTHANGGTLNNCFTDAAIPDVSTKDVFLGLSVDGDTSTLYAFDGNGLQNTHTGTAERNQTSGEYLTAGIGDTRRLDAIGDDIWISTTDAFTEIDWKSVWEETQR